VNSFRDDDYANGPELRAEVECLRAENAKLFRQNDQLHDVATMLERARADCDRWRNEAAKLAVDTADAHWAAKLEAENAELRDAAKYWDGLRRQLAWFEERESAVRDDASFCADQAHSDVEAYEREHPRPEGT
jgi:hypothetical protein